MAPTRDRAGDLEAAKKRKRDKADLQEERQNRKKQKSKRKSLPEQNGEKDDEAPSRQNNVGLQTADEVEVSNNLQIVTQNTANGQVEILKSPASWIVSKPMGGRILDIDPVFSVDEV